MIIIDKSSSSQTENSTVQQPKCARLKQTTLPQRVHNILASCPKAGSGVHRWLFRSALKLHPYFEKKEDLERALEEATSSCGRDVPDSEIENAVRNSDPARLNALGQGETFHRWPERNEEQILAIVRDGPNFAQLADLSPVKWADDARHTEQIIDTLFPGSPLICAGRTQKLCGTASREKWPGFLEKLQFIVPSPMSAKHGMTKDGRRSMRTLDNTGPRRFIAVEFDTGTFDMHAAVLMHLAKFAPLVMVVHSGNKSLHGWFFCARDPDSAVATFFSYAVSLGADPATWSRCQLVRMPDGQRENGKRQQVVYFNPEGMEKTI